MRQSHLQGLVLLFFLAYAQSVCQGLEPSAKSGTRAERRVESDERNVDFWDRLGTLSAKFEHAFVEYEVQEGDSLLQIAARHGSTAAAIRCLNPALASDTIYPGERLRVFRQPPRVVVDTVRNTLAIYIGGVLVKEYSVSTGTGGVHATPKGEFKVTQVLWNPHDYQNSAPPGDPRNQYGPVWISLNIPGYGIHGTNDPQVIGKDASEGCIRMLSLDVIEVAQVVASMTVVEIR